MCELFGMSSNQPEDIASYGQFNFLMSDSEVMIAYGHDQLNRWTSPVCEVTKVNGHTV